MRCGRVFGMSGRRGPSQPLSRIRLDAMALLWHCHGYDQQVAGCPKWRYSLVVIHEMNPQDMAIRRWTCTAYPIWIIALTKSVTTNAQEIIMLSNYDAIDMYSFIGAKPLLQ